VPLAPKHPNLPGTSSLGPRCPHPQAGLQEASAQGVVLDKATLSPLPQIPTLTLLPLS